MDSFSPEEIRIAFEVALREKFFKGINEKKQSSFSENVSVPQEICMELGQDMGVDEDQIRSYLVYNMQIIATRSEQGSRASE